MSKVMLMSDVSVVCVARAGLLHVCRLME